MGKCKHCGKQGLFLRLRQEYCEDCYSRITEFQFMVPQWIRIINESVEILNNTRNVETFFSRYELILSQIENLAASEEYASFASQTSSELRERLHIQIDNAIGEVIDKNFQDVLNKICSLKTSKAKVNACEKFFNMLKTYKKYFNDDNVMLAVNVCNVLRKEANILEKLTMVDFDL